MNYEKEWNEMREWLNNSGMANRIRSLAVKSLQSDWPEGEGMGSSDISCEVMNIYREYKPLVILSCISSQKKRKSISDER